MVKEEATRVADDRPRTVEQLLDLITRERGALEQAVAGMGDDALVATSGGWSVKDHLAHVAAWERRLVGEVQGDHHAARFGLDEATFSATNTDSFNALLHARHRDDPPATVRTEFRASGEALRAAFAELSDADLLQPVRPDDPDVETLVDLIAWDTFKHYPEHVRAITGHA
ncbi:MAG: DinB family protein [Chloroflexota bacterium]|nr:DinB family protein [Chloroflexota bacterium]